MAFLDKAFGPGVSAETAVVFMPDQLDFLRVFQTAISRSLIDCGFAAGRVEQAFDSRGWLSDVAEFARKQRGRSWFSFSSRGELSAEVDGSGQILPVPME